MPYYYGFDWTYIVLVLPCVILSLWASANVNSTFKRYSQQYSRRGLTGAQAAAQVLSANGVSGVRIERISGNLTDHYDPRTNVIRLSDDVYGSTSTAAIGVACHEAGHAAQHAENYTPIKVRNALLMPCQIGSRAAIPLAVIGIFLGSQLLVNIGIFFYVFVMLFQLVTLPVEFNASRRAVDVIENTGMLSYDELPGAKRVLKAAAMTYVASFAVSAANLLRLLLLTNNKRR